MDNPMLAALLDAREQQRILQDREELPKNMTLFVQKAWPVLKPQELYRHNWHIEAICERLQAISAGQILRQQIWVPPGTMKSLTVSVFWHAWEWILRPSLRYWGASYETRLAGRLSSMSRDLMMSEWYQTRFGSGWEFTREAEYYYANNVGGTRLATAPQSTGSGEHGDRIIIDDPINARAADATSGTVLDEANSWYDGTVSSRGIGDDHVRVIVMQRLHEKDLAAHVLDLEEWEVLCLPERYFPKHPFMWPDDPRQVEGELLWPAHRGEKLSNALARALGPRAAGQLQQMPSAREGQIIKRHWWRFYDSRIRSEEKWAQLPKFTMIVTSVDTPLKDKETSDNVAAQVWGVKGADRYLLDLRLGKMNYGLAKRTVKEMGQWARKTWPYCPHFVLIENAGYGPELIDDLKRELTGVTKIPGGNEGNKETRAESATDSLESGNQFLPGYGPPWQPAYDEAKTPADVVAFIDNLALFNNAAHDDDVDAWSQVHNWLRGRQAQPIRTGKARPRQQAALPRR